MIACGCGPGAGLLTLSLGEAVAVGLGFKEGLVRFDVLAVVSVAWLYFIVVGVGHWQLSRALPWLSAEAKHPAPDAPLDASRHVGLDR